MPTLYEQLPPGVVDALKRNQPIEAIKLLREATGLGLAEAKDLIDAHRGGISTERFDPAQGDALPTDVGVALRRGDKIEAIRLLRGHEGLGLKEAKDKIDAAAGRLKIGRDGFSPGEVRESGSGKWLLVAAIVAAAIGWYIFFGRA